MPIDVIVRLIAEIAKILGADRAQFFNAISLATYEGLPNDDETSRVDLIAWVGEIYPEE